MDFERIGMLTPVKNAFDGQNQNLNSFKLH